MPFLDINSGLLLEELLSAACSKGVGVFKRNKQVKYSSTAVKKGSPSLPPLALKLMWGCCCHCGKAGVSEQVCMFPHHSCGKLRAFSRDSQIQWFFSVSPSYHWLCGMKATGPQFGAMVLSSPLLEGVLVLVRRSCPKAAPFYRPIPKSLFQVPLNQAGSYSWENL